MTRLEQISTFYTFRVIPPDFTGRAVIHRIYIVIKIVLLKGTSGDTFANKYTAFRAGKDPWRF